MVEVADVEWCVDDVEAGQDDQDQGYDDDQDTKHAVDDCNNL